MLVLFQARNSTRLSYHRDLAAHRAQKGAIPSLSSHMDLLFTQALLRLLDSAPKDISELSTDPLSHHLLHLSTYLSIHLSLHLWSMHPSTHHHLICNSCIHLLMHPLVQHLLGIPSPSYPTTHASIHPTIYSSSYILSIIHSSIHNLNIHHLPIAYYPC